MGAFGGGAAGGFAAAGTGLGGSIGAARPAPTVPAPAADSTVGPDELPPPMPIANASAVSSVAANATTKPGRTIVRRLRCGG